MGRSSNQRIRSGRLRLVGLIAAIGFLGVCLPASATDVVWTTLPEMPTARADLAVESFLCPSPQKGRCIYAIGGEGEEAGIVGTVQAFSPALNGWTTLAPLPTPRKDLAAAEGNCPPVAVTGPTKGNFRASCIYAIGGQDGGGGGGGVVESYNRTTNAWMTRASLPTPRRDLAAAVVLCPPGQSGLCVYAIGGETTDGNDTTVGTVEAYNPDSNTWSTVTPMPTPRRGLTAVAAQCPGGENLLCIYAIGGEFSSDGVPLTRLGTVEVYHPKTNAWMTRASLPTPRSDLAGSIGACPPGQTGSCVYAIGGINSNHLTVGALEAYDPFSDGWTTLPSMPTARSNLDAGTAPCPPGHTGSCVYAVGGFDDVGDLVGTTEAFDPPGDQKGRKG